MDSVITLGLFKNDKLFSYLPKDARYFTLPSFNGSGLNALMNNSDITDMAFNKTFNFLQEHIIDPPNILCFYGSFMHEDKFHEVYKAVLEKDSVIELDGIERMLWVPLKDYDDYSLDVFSKKNVLPLFYNKDVVEPSLNGRNVNDKRYSSAYLKNL